MCIRDRYWGRVNRIGIRSCYDEGRRCAETLFFNHWHQHKRHDVYPDELTGPINLGNPRRICDPPTRRADHRADRQQVANQLSAIAGQRPEPALRRYQTGDQGTAMGAPHRLGGRTKADHRLLRTPIGCDITGNFGRSAMTIRPNRAWPVPGLPDTRSGIHPTPAASRCR